MKFKVEIQPAGIEYQSEANLLDDALKQNITLEHSCKNGDCGSCCAELLSGSVENEKGVVISFGELLTCKSKPLTDIVLRANYFSELVDFKLINLPCKVVSYDFVAEDILVVKLRFPPTAQFNYLPGQYVDLKINGIKRSYSNGNSRSCSNGLELHIRKVPDGKMSELVFNTLKLNQLMQIEGPKGTFFIRESEKPLLFLAGGTGIAPVKAMVEELIHNYDKRKVYIYWGMPNAKSFYLEEFFQKLSCKPNMTFIPVLSGGESWTGRTGFVHEAVCEDFETLDAFQIYACGSPLMISAAKQAFRKKMLPDGEFFSDAFTPAI
jgi:CDP-4-dehydro-6-deoxyglucose reductase